MTDTNTKSGPGGDELVAEAAEIVDQQMDPPMSLVEFIDEVVEHGEYACSAPEYLLRAIEHFGTRIIVEAGEEIERYRFFDDPANDGEHAILGNTKLLNEFVEDLRAMARGPANEAKMFWFEGPTATGKSELKRCLINGIREFSKTDEGKRFTIEWNVTGGDTTVGSMTYGTGGGSASEQDWYESPVQSNPLSVLPESVRARVLYGRDADPDEWVPPDIDPFSAEAYDILDRRYDGDFEKITSSDHLRVNRYHLDVGRGIGVLQSEDAGYPSQKLVGEWMHGVVKELDSRGRRNPQAMSYDGVLSQGNSGLTVIEDAGHHIDTILKMLSVPEADQVKIDRRTVLPIDTVPVIISNPDMYAELKSSASNEFDTFRPIRRRLDRFELPYLVTPTIEAELIHRLLKGRESVWDDTDTDRLQRSVRFGPDESGSWIDDDVSVEMAPHTLEAIAYYDVVTRITGDGDIDRITKARIYDGEDVDVEDDGDEFTVEDLDEDVSNTDGRRGIPCTFTRDVIADVLSSVEMSVGDDHPVVMPLDALDAMATDVHDSTIFNQQEAMDIDALSDSVDHYIFEKQEDDVLRALLHDHVVSNEEVSEYIEHVYCWGTDEDSVDPDPLKMKVFETEHLGLFDESHYNLDTNSGVSQQVQEFRRENVIQAVSTYLYENRGSEYTVDTDDVPVGAVPEIEERLTEYDWDDVANRFEDLDPYQWDDPLAGTATDRIKSETVEHMTMMFDYTNTSARKTTEAVFGVQKSHDRWGDT